jgi:hypothetical protein
MKKFVLLLMFVVFFCLSMSVCAYVPTYVPTNVPSAVAASNAARRSAERRREKREQHEKEYHQGNLVYDVSFSEIYNHCEPYPVIEKYEIRHYYYEIDPDKCLIKVDKELIAKRLATTKEIDNHKSGILIISIVITILVTFLITILIFAIIYK